MTNLEWAVAVLLSMGTLSAIGMSCWFAVSESMEENDGPLEMLDTRPSLADSSGRLRWSSDDDLSRVRADFKARLARQQATEAQVHRAVNALRRSR